MKNNGIELTYNNSLCFLRERECSTGIVAAAAVSRDNLQHGGRVGNRAGGRGAGASRRVAESLVWTTEAACASSACGGGVAACSEGRTVSWIIYC